ICGAFVTSPDGYGLYKMVKAHEARAGLGMKTLMMLPAELGLENRVRLKRLGINLINKFSSIEKWVEDIDKILKKTERAQS
ncbi:MAG: hypothetical protein PHP46_06100, partial [Candidatus Omnitrophica bacterium]|nr:hypothetical protein [Candidatus Omnitrophota bacterium]